MPYVPRQDFDTALDELNSLLTSGSVEPKLADYARSLILQRPLKLLRCVIGGRVTSQADKVSTPGCLFEPSDTYLALFAALTANDIEIVKAIADEFVPQGNPAMGVSDV
jgi:hypothetical protein